MKDDVLLKDLLLTNYHYIMLKSKNKKLRDYSECYETIEARYVISGQKQITAGQVAQCKNNRLIEDYRKYEDAVYAFGKLIAEQWKFAIKYGETEDHSKLILDELRNILFVLGFEKEERLAIMFNALAIKQERWNDCESVKMAMIRFVPCFVTRENISGLCEENDRIWSERTNDIEIFEWLICELYRKNYVECNK